MKLFRSHVLQTTMVPPCIVIAHTFTYDGVHVHKAVKLISVIAFILQNRMECLYVGIHIWRLNRYPFMDDSQVFAHLFKLLGNKLWSVVLLPLTHMRNQTIPPTKKCLYSPRVLLPI